MVRRARSEVVAPAIVTAIEPGTPSVTAQRVARYRLGFERLQAPFGDPGADEGLAEDVASALPEPPSGMMGPYLEARTRFFDRVVVDAVTRGVRQFVAIGAGYDGRALRYAKDGVRWFEVDHPDTQADKRRRLERLGIAAPGVEFVSLAISFSVAGVGSERRQRFSEGVAALGEPVRSTSSIEDAERLLAATGWRRRDTSEGTGRAGFVTAAPR